MLNDAIKTKQLKTTQHKNFEMINNNQQTITQLKSILDKHQQWLVITGAGVSQNSGIPTYRDEKGQWQRSRPIQHQEFVQYEDKRKRYWARSAVGWPPVARAQPNVVHYALAKLEQKGYLAGVITQNVDRLHQKAGHQQVIDLHGRLDRVQCLSCQTYECREQLQNRLLQKNPFLNQVNAEIAPDGDAHVEDQLTEQIEPVGCSQCQGILMPDVVFYGGTVPRETNEATQQLYQKSKGLLVLGSSLMVYSSFRFCKQAKQDNKPIVIINQGVTRADDLANYKFEVDCQIIEALL
ncbi:NAD-dependent protein deacetylase [Aliikangiella maris]